MTTATTKTTPPAVPLVWTVPDCGVMVKPSQGDKIDGELYVYIVRYPMLERAMLASQAGGFREWNWDHEIVGLGRLLDFGLARCPDINASQFMPIASMVNYLDGGLMNPTLDHLALLHEIVDREGQLTGLRLEASPSSVIYSLSWDQNRETAKFVGQESFTFPITVSRSRTEKGREIKARHLTLTEQEWEEEKSPKQLQRWLHAPFAP